MKAAKLGFGGLLCAAAAFGLCYQTDSWVLGYPKSRNLAQDILDATGLYAAKLSHVTQDDTGYRRAWYRLESGVTVSVSLLACDATLNCADNVSFEVRKITDQALIRDAVAQIYSSCLGVSVDISDVGVIAGDVRVATTANLAAMPMPDDGHWTLAAHVRILLDDMFANISDFEKSRHTCITELIDHRAFGANPPSSASIQLLYAPHISVVPKTYTAPYTAADRANQLSLIASQSVTVLQGTHRLGPLIGMTRPTSFTAPYSSMATALDSWLDDQPQWRGHTLQPDLMYVMSEMRGMGNALDAWRVFVVVRNQEGRPAVVALTYHLASGVVDDIVMVHPWGDPLHTERPNWPDNGDLYLP